ncbi:ABC transporter2C permease protein2C putative [gamma proteobacterium IMCC2047]|nr:ABC transporter2C permease protein2C putative [gamma proteobacterium IMCC2047]
MRVIRRDLAPLPIKGWLVFSAAWLALCLLVLLFTRELFLVLALLVGLTLILVLLAAVIWLMLRISKGIGITQLGLVGQGFKRILRRSKSYTLQMTALAMTLMLMAVLGMLRAELLDNWSAQIPDDVPNHFAFNIMPTDTEQFSQAFSGQGMSAPPLYPMVRGRLTKINGVDINAELFTDKDEAAERRSDGSLNRELNLSWTDSLPADNEIVSGQWHSGASVEKAAATVSVEEGLAERLGIGLQDELEFDIAGQPLKATVTSLRSVVWESFTPNFYMLFSPGALNNLPATYVTSFRLDAEQRQLLMKLVQAFPSITILEIDALIAQLQTILEQVTTLVEIMLLFVLLAGLCVLLAIIQSDLDERLREGALMRALGASRRYLQWLNYIEFSLLGLLAGVLAMAGAELVTALLYQRVFDLPSHWHWHWPFWLGLPVFAGLLVAVVGNIAVQRTANQSPMQLLNRR